MKTDQYIADDSKYYLGKDLKGKEQTTKELHEVLLKMVLEVDRVCRKNNIPYALAFGSALGAYNYGGFIPWDDDVDIIIDYDDIPRIVEAFQKDLGQDFYFDCYETNKKYNVLIPTMKLKMRHTYLKEKNVLLPNRCGSENGVFVDICAFMGVPQSYKEHIKLIKYAKRRMAWYVFLDGILHIHPYRLKAKLKAFEKKVAEQYHDSPFVSQTVIIPFQDWSSDLGSKQSLSFPREVIFPFREYDFCGHKIFSLNNVEEFCRLRYGEKSLKKYVDGRYVDNYPQSKRKANHIMHFSFTSSLEEYKKKKKQHKT